MRQWIVILALLATGCVAKYRDVSEVVEYRDIINGQYLVKERMYISGVNAPPGYGKEVNFYSIGPVSPTWGGRELITRDTLEAGSIFTIIKVRRCTNCLYEGVEAMVSLESFETEVDVPVYINIDYINSTDYVQHIK